MTNTNPTAAQPLDPSDMDDIEALALAAPQVWYGTYQIADGITDENAVALIEACSPDTILALIAQARAAQPESATGTTGASELLPEDLLDELNDAVIEAFNGAFAIKDWSARDHWRDVLNRFEDWRAQGRDAPASAQPAQHGSDAYLRKLLNEADDLLFIASDAMLKIGLRDKGSDCGLPHEVRRFALEFSNEGRDGPGTLQVRGTGRYRAWLKAVRSLDAPAAVAPSDAKGKAVILPLELAQRCLSSMKQAVTFGETGKGRPPSQTCLFEIEELEAILKGQSHIGAKGKADAANAGGLEPDMEFKRLADTILQATTNGARLEALRGMAELFDRAVATSAADAKDAVRYRFMAGVDVPSHSSRWQRWRVEYWQGYHGGWAPLVGTDLDEAIDAQIAAMAAAPSSEKGGAA